MTRTAVLLCLSLAGCASAALDFPEGAPPDPARVDAVARALVQAQAWKTDADRRRAAAYLCDHAERRHADALFLLVERGDARDWPPAAMALAPLLTPENLPQIEASLEHGDTDRLLRTLTLLKLARLGASRPLLEKHAPRLLDPKRRELSKVALGTLADVGARGATPAIMAYLDADDADDGAAVKALGRLWEQRLDARPPAGGSERTRLQLLLLVHRLAMAAASVEACEAMLRVMTRAELEEFLSKHAKDRFAARDLVAQAAGRETFDPKKGALVHRALLANSDPDVVALVLWSSPHKLEIRGLLGDDRPARLRGLPEARVCDYAAARLEAEESKKPVEIDASKDAREKLLGKWLARRPQ